LRADLHAAGWEMEDRPTVTRSNGSRGERLVAVLPKPTSMKLATRDNGTRDGELVVVLARSRAVRRGARDCANLAGGPRCLDHRPALALRHRRRARREADARRRAVRSRPRDGPATPGLSMGRRLGLRQSRRARAQGARPSRCRPSSGPIR
jgi:hypothetical protein